MVSQYDDVVLMDMTDRGSAFSCVPACVRLDSAVRIVQHSVSAVSWITAHPVLGVRVWSVMVDRKRVALSAVVCMYQMYMSGYACRCLRSVKDTCVLGGWHAMLYGGQARCH